MEKSASTFRNQWETVICDPRISASCTIIVIHYLMADSAYPTHEISIELVKSRKSIVAQFELLYVLTELCFKDNCPPSAKNETLLSLIMQYISHNTAINYLDIIHLQLSIIKNISVIEGLLFIATEIENHCKKLTTP